MSFDSQHPIIVLHFKVKPSNYSSLIGSRFRARWRFEIDWCVCMSNWDDFPVLTLSVEMFTVQSSYIIIAFASGWNETYHHSHKQRKSPPVLGFGGRNHVIHKHGINHHHDGGDATTTWSLGKLNYLFNIYWLLPSVRNIVDRSFHRWARQSYVGSSATRLGDLLYFGQLFKAQGNHYFAQIANTF